MEWLLNWLWQGCAVAGLAGMALGVAGRRVSAATRYCVWWLALLLILIVPLLPGLDLSRLDATRPLAPRVVLPSPAPPDLPAWPAVIIAGAWLLWIAVRGGRAVRAALGLAGTRRRATPFPDARERRLPSWSLVRDHGRHARLMVSNDVRLAGVLGSRRPLIAVSPALLDELTDAELDRVVVHEWTHVQRRDDAGRIVQLVVDAIAGFHPAVWWVSRRLDLEREAACDDWTVALTGSSATYAECLVRLAEVPAARRDVALVPAALTTSSLEARLRRLLDGGRNGSHRPSLAALAALAPGVLLISILAAEADVIAVANPFIALPATPSRAEVEFPGRLAVPASPSVAEATFGYPSAGEAAGAGRPAPVGAGRPSMPAGVFAVPELPAAAPLGSPITMSPFASRLQHVTSQAPLVSGDAPIPPDSLVSTAEGGASAPAPPEQAAANGTPWGAASDAGLAVGRGTQKAAQATAGFFGRLGKRIAGSF